MQAVSCRYQIPCDAHKAYVTLKIKINAHYHHLSLSSINTLLNVLREGISREHTKSAAVRGAERLASPSHHGEVLMKIIEDVIRKTCLLSGILIALLLRVTLH